MEEQESVNERELLVFCIGHTGPFLCKTINGYKSDIRNSSTQVSLSEQLILAACPVTDLKVPIVEEKIQMEM